MGEIANACTLKMPFIIVSGTDECSSLWLNGAVHSNELNGYVAIRNVAFDIE